MTGSTSPAPDRIGWLDCSGGASGDMLLGALVGAGVPVEVIAGAVGSLGLSVTIDVRPATGVVLAAQQATVTADEVDPPARSLTTITALLDAASLDPRVRDLARAIFERLARAEATVHGTTTQEVHFHEVGALDAIADIVGCAAGFVHLSLDAIVVSPIALGSGLARGAHGTLPVPVPAVLELLREAGLPVTAGDAPFEQCTPTGAAVIAEVATDSGQLPPMTVRAVGSGVGTRRGAQGPSVLRLVVGSATLGPPVPSALVLATNIDDLDPRLWPAVLEALLDAGASDAWVTPILMKKGRPAHTLSVLCAADRAPALRAVVFRETSAIGLREVWVGKHALDRVERSVDVHGATIRVKVASLDGEVVNVQPEYADVAAAARTSSRPVKVVLGEAIAAAHRDGLIP